MGIMISWRIRRQFAVLLIIAIPIVFMGILLFPKILPEPTCFDGRRNQGEVEVDCGGPCAPCELKNPRPLSIFWARAVAVRPNVYDVAAEVQNNNEVLSSPRVDYEFSLFDDLGLIAVKSGRTFIYAQERVHMIEANLETSREPRRVEFKVLNVEWKLAETPRPAIAVERRDYKVVRENTRSQSVVEATVSNRTVFDFRKVEVGFLVLDGEGNMIGTNRILVENLNSGSRRDIKTVWPEELQGKVDTIFVEPRVNIFESGVIVRPQ